jgi:hypothetical protein
MSYPVRYFYYDNNGNKLGPVIVKGTLYSTVKTDSDAINMINNGLTPNLKNRYDSVSAELVKSRDGNTYWSSVLEMRGNIRGGKYRRKSRKMRKNKSKKSKKGRKIRKSRKIKY